jgi:hypothetical protein
MSLASGIRELYPDSLPNEDWVVVDHSDGRGPRIEIWNEEKLGPRPDDATLRAAGVERENRVMQEKQEQRIEEDAIRAIDASSIRDPVLQKIVSYLQRRFK